MALSDTRFLNRRRALAAKLAAQRVDSILVTHLTHVRYLSGFSGSNGALLVNKDLSAKIATDGRYITQIAEEVPDIEAAITRNVAAALLGEITGPRRVGYEADFVTVAQLEKLTEAAGEDVVLVPISGVIEDLRLTKDALEIERLREVARLANEALARILDKGVLRAGVSERDVAAALEYEMRIAGAERPSFDTIVASGPNGAKPHHSSTDRIIEAGDLVTIDFGAHDRGFNSDTTRTFAVGEIDAQSKEIYEVVLAAQLAGCDAAVPGALLVDVDRACRKVIEDAGYGEYFVHSTGHGIGLDVHEPPAAASTGTGSLKENMTLTIEPGIYIPGKGGVRIEDTLLITAGKAENFTDPWLPKELRVF